MTNFYGHVNSNPLTDSERQKYRADIHKLRQEREVLLIESQRQKHEEQELESQIQLLRDRLQQLEHRQYNFASYFARVMQKPELALMPQLENHDRKRRVSSRPDHFHDDTSNEDTSMVTHRTSRRGSPDNSTSLDFDTELLDKMESSLTFWEMIVEDIDTLNMSKNTSLEFAESTNCAVSPAISYTQLNIEDQWCDSPRIDMNSEPSSAPSLVNPDPGQRREKEAVAQRVNDVFWEQFLTENPSSYDLQEVQSERKEPGMREKENRLLDHGKYCLGFRNANKLPEHIGQLTQAGSS